MMAPFARWFSSDAQEMSVAHPSLGLNTTPDPTI